MCVGISVQPLVDKLQIKCAEKKNKFFLSSNPVTYHSIAIAKYLYSKFFLYIYILFASYFRLLQPNEPKHIFKILFSIKIIFSQSIFLLLLCFISSAQPSYTSISFQLPFTSHIWVTFNNLQFFFVFLEIESISVSHYKIIFN